MSPGRTMLTPTVEPSCGGLTTKGGAMGEAARASVSETVMPSAQAMPAWRKMSLASGLFMAAAEARTPEWV